MQTWKTVGVRLSEADLTALNQRLAQSGFRSLGELVRAYAMGIVDNGHLVDPLAEKVADNIVNKLLTSKLATKPDLASHETSIRCGRRDLNPGYKLGGLVSYWRF